MKYTIEGFSQKVAFELGLDVLDLVILRWFVDFKDSGNMRVEYINGQKYYWVQHRKLPLELPVLNLKQNAFYRRLKKMSDVGVLKKYVFKLRGTYTYYTTGENYINLISGEAITQAHKSKPANIEDDFSYFDDDIMSFEVIDPSFDETPIDMNSTHSSLDSTPVDLNSTHSSFDTTPVDLNSTHSSLDATPIDLNSTHSSFDTTPVDLNSTHSSLDATPIDLNSTHSSFDTTPVDLKSTHIINPSNNSSITQAKGDEDSSESLLAELMWSFIKIKNPSFKKPNLKSWAKAFRFILNDDNRSLQEVTDLLKWIYVENPFWGVHVLNPWSFRNKYDDILARKNYEKSNPHKGIYSPFDSFDLSDFEDME